MSFEVWKPVVGFESWYRVSDQGGFARMTGKGLMPRKGTILASGHVSVHLHAGGRSRRTYLHVIMAEAHLGPAPSPMHIVRHLDDEPSHNVLDNLAWGTRRENYDDAVRNGRF